MKFIRKGQELTALLWSVVAVAVIVFIVAAACHVPAPGDQDHSPNPPGNSDNNPPPGDGDDHNPPPPPPGDNEPPPPPPVNTTPGAVRPLPAPTGCTKLVTSSSAAESAVKSAKAGDVICLTGNLKGAKLDVGNDGTEAKPIKILGDGNTVISGLEIGADWVYVSGLNIDHPNPAPGIWAEGNHITVENSTVDTPSGGDGDTVRFFGSFITFRHNTFAHTNNKNGHADGSQSFQTDSSTPETHDIVFEYNRMVDIANICLIWEGPNSSYGDGSGKGKSYNLLFKGNYCQANSAQAIWLDDVTDWTVVDNTFDGGVDHAVGVTNGSTGGHMANNTFNGIDCKIGMDSSSEEGYTGPKSTCEP